MRKLLIGLGVLFTLLVVAILVLPSLVPASVYKTKIEQQISDSLGRKVTISGDVKLSVFPTLSANANVVTIDNADNFSQRPFATMESLKAKVKLMPLLKKQVEITEFILIKPKFSLEKLKTGETNWIFTSKNESTIATKPSTPIIFKRDGRYTDAQMSLGVFQLTHGEIDYTDHAKNTHHVFKSVNLHITMPDMDKPVAAKGDLIFNNIPMTIDTRLNTPKAFLNAQAAPFYVKLKSDLISLTADGTFTPSQDITFDVNFDADIPSTAKLNALLGINNPYGVLSESAMLKGALQYDGNNLTAKNANFTVSSDIITTQFQGDFSAGTKPSATGDLTVKIGDLHRFQKTLGFNYPQTTLVNTLDFSTQLTTDGTVTQGTNTILDIKGELINANYHGDAKFDNALSLDGDFNATSTSISALMDKLGITSVKGSIITRDFSISGHMAGQIDTLSLSALDLKTKSNDLTANYSGNIQLGEVVSLNGSFDAQSPSVTNLITQFGMPVPRAANALGTINISGNISGPTDAISAKNIKFNTIGEHLTASYIGDVKMGEQLNLNGNFESLIPSMKTFAAQTGFTHPYVNAIGKFTAKGKVIGTPDTLTLSNIDTALTEGLLNLQFNGSAQTGKAISYEGQLRTNITSVRQLAALGGTELAASTDQGKVYGPFTLSGLAKGTLKNISFTGAQFKLDHLSGTGNLNANLANVKPHLGGTLNLQGLDLRPYMAAQNPSGEIQPWSEEPLNLAALKLFNANLTLNTPNVLIGRTTLGQSTIKTVIKNGLLTTDIPNVSLYGGQGDLHMVLDANTAVPQIDIDFKLDNMDALGFLGAAAGFTKLTGNTGTTMKFHGAGRSQAEIMRSLSGNGNFELAEGIITGVDMAQFVGGLDSAFQSRSLPAGIGSQYTTPFEKLAGLFTVQNGIVKIGKFNLNAKTVNANGAGTLDIGKQHIDFSLQPKLIDGKGLAGFGIPIRFSGGFGNVKAGLDTDLLGKIIAARAKAKLQSELSKQVGGSLGGLLGGVLGAPQPQPKASTPTNTQTAKPADPLGSLLGDLLGTDNTKTPPKGQQKTEPKKEKKKKEDPLEKALQDLFGGN